MNPLMLAPLLLGRGGGLGRGLKLSSSMVIGSAMFGLIPASLNLGLPTFTLPGGVRVNLNDPYTLGQISGLAPLNTSAAMLGVTGTVPALADAGRVSLLMRAFGLGGGVLGGGRRTRRSYRRYRRYRRNRRRR